MPTPSLAANDRFPRIREVERAFARFTYRYYAPDENAVAPVAVAKCFRIGKEIYSLSWGLRHLPLVIQSSINREVKRPWLRFLDWWKSPASLEPFDVIPGPYHRPPAESRDYRDDGWFAFRRVGGACPTVIARLSSVADLSARMPGLTDAVFRSVTGASESLSDAIDAKRLFVADYVALQRALRPERPENPRDSRFRDKYLPAPVLVLYERPATGTAPAELVPVAITPDQPGSSPELEGSAPNPMWTPRDGMAWQIAKTYVEVADNNWHFAIGHLWRCHFLMEAFAVATRRNLPSCHPIRMLLDPHLRFTIFTNVIAYRYFAKSGLLYDRMYSGELLESRLLFEASSRTRSSALDHLPSRDLAARKMDEGLAHYPWRDDALAWEDLVRRYVRTIVEAVYPNDGALLADREIVEFAEELRDTSGGNVPGVFASIDRGSLIEALTLALYTAGAGHSAMHFPMIDLYTYAPTQCESAWAPPIVDATEATATRFRATLPPIEEALENYYQVEIGHFRYDVFADFHEYAIGSLGLAANAIARLRADLAVLKQRIEDRERTTPPRRGYPYLHPSLVTNSVNI